MIAAATLKQGKITHKLRFTTGALMRFEEDNNGKAFDVLLDDLIQGKGGVRLLVSALSAGLDNGAGVAREEAIALVDVAGGARQVVSFVGDAIAKAFPPPSGDAPGKGEETAGKASPPAGA